LRVRLLAFGSFGAFVGLGLYVVRISEAASYLSDDPKACINCHVMFPEYATWRHSSHGRVTNCNDCHVPHHNDFEKYLFKAKDGMRHSFIFTFRLEPQVIYATKEAREVIQENCVRCHGNVMSAVAGGAHGGSSHDGMRSCISCHREVPHGRVHSLSSTPNASIPPLSPVTPEWMR